MKPASDEMFYGEQMTGEVLASELMGESIYNSQDEGIGEVTDVIATEDGQIKALVVGVGGFLGIGTKDVAVNYDKFVVVSDNENTTRVVLDTNRESLESAPEYVTLAEKAAEQPMQPSTGSATTDTPATTAPATGTTGTVTQ
ncbi:PRC-barrel domain-containing protein [Methylobrevis pamukkalensis]|uniref:PRC-barrel domain protein n=1 Tax=Methylobrevis pamukkalensis TaxID=1439726 RepID=A0A1E3GYV2_9HYPH|nr:PRC-barrel domain-containing protein [Methylobrevis pamukkalensis]ODN69240.1 PRC-barrel domain protein [Methylobrevis pamukkalensis]